MPNTGGVVNEHTGGGRNVRLLVGFAAVVWIGVLFSQGFGGGVFPPGATGVTSEATVPTNSGAGAAVLKTSTNVVGRTVQASAGVTVVQSTDEITIGADAAITPQFYTGSGVPSINCTQGRDVYTDTAAGNKIYRCSATNTWSELATLTGTQTLTNKTLTAPIISTISNTGTLTLPTSTGTLARTVDNVSTATALAANGANCSSGQAPLGVDASGAAEGCFTPGGGATVDITGGGGCFLSSNCTDAFKVSGQVLTSDVVAYQIKIPYKIKFASAVIQHGVAEVADKYIAFALYANSSGAPSTKTSGTDCRVKVTAAYSGFEDTACPSPSTTVDPGVYWLIYYSEAQTATMRSLDEGTDSISAWYMRINAGGGKGTGTCSNAATGSGVTLTAPTTCGTLTFANKFRPQILLSAW